MKILLSAMAAVAETAGPASRCRLLDTELAKAGAEVATCMAGDVNYKPIDGIKNFFLDVPMPFGLPKVIATRTFPIAQKLGITSRKTVASFDDVLNITGNINYNYLKKSVNSIRAAIQEFKPDIVYSEFNMSAFIAAKIEKITTYATVSYPSQYEYAHSTKLAKGLNRLLDEFSIDRVDSALRLFDWADKAFCPSISELEPIKKDNVIFCGALKTVTPKKLTRNKILVYMGNGTISASKTEQVVTQAFAGSVYEVYIASKYLQKKDAGNIHIAPRWDFDQLLHESVCFINHGGQNSVVDGLIHGVPQIVVPGKVFERKYNAKSLTDNDAGIAVDYYDFTADHIRTIANQIIHSSQMRQNALALGKKLTEGGGVGVIVENIMR